MYMLNEIKVAGIVYPIENRTGNDLTGLLGYTDLNNAKIVISSQYPVNMQHQTLLHEILHAISYAYGADLTEQQVDSLAKGLYATIRDNPQYTIL